MNAVRIIPRLDIKGPDLVKGIHLEGLRVLGKPQEFARYYYENNADELIYQDVVASLYERNSLHEIITRTAREIFIPLTVGGGIRTLEDITSVLRAGADKVAINTAALKNPDLIRKSAERFGSSTIVISIELIKEKDNRYFAYTDNGREHTGVEVISWAKQVEELGAGEIILTSVDREGTGDGFDNDLVEKVSKAVTIPVIAHGGAGKMQDVQEIFNSGADAVSIASMFHYNTIDNLKKVSVEEAEGNVEFLKSKKGFAKVESTSINELKTYLDKQNINCRLNGEAKI
ncbi:MAG: imidazole glycerol phosphate synthase subunit HisF [Bacteroidetes bacterium]|nr:imidazole glycerol phosphate synthase subunit HisF [Bacteroidota bacterium]